MQLKSQMILPALRNYEFAFACMPGSKLLRARWAFSVSLHFCASPKSDDLILSGFACLIGINRRLCGFFGPPYLRP